MQIIILSKRQTHTLKISAWMYAGLAATCCLFVALPTGAYLLGKQQANSTPLYSMQAQVLEGSIHAFSKKIGEIQNKMYHLTEVMQTVKKTLGMNEQGLKPQKSAPSQTGQGGNIVLSAQALTHPYASETAASDVMVALLEDASASESASESSSKNEINKISEVVKTADVKKNTATSLAAKASTLAKINGLLNQLSNQIQQYGDEVNSIQALLEFKRRQTTTQHEKVSFDMLPVRVGNITSGFGWRADPFHGNRTLHAGQDFAAPLGTPIYAVKDGIVSTSQYHPQYGNMIDIDHGGGLKTRYAHAQTLLVKAGDVVKKGSLLANMGSTGRSTGSHLHFEVRLNNVPYNPSLFIPGTVLVQNSR